MRDYGNSKTDAVISVCIIIMIIVVACMLSGCVNRGLVESYDQYLQTAGTEYIEYVDKDHTLDDDSKLLRRINHEQAQKTVDRFKQTRWSW